MLTLKVSLSGPQASQTRIVLQGLFRHNSGPKAVRGSAVYGWPEGGVGTVWGGLVLSLRSPSRALPLRRFGAHAHRGARASPAVSSFCLSFAPLLLSRLFPHFSFPYPCFCCEQSSAEGNSRAVCCRCSAPSSLAPRAASACQIPVRLLPPPPPALFSVLHRCPSRFVVQMSGSDPGWLSRYIHLPLNQWPLWARGCHARSTASVHGAAAISAHAAAAGVSLPRGHATSSVASRLQLDLCRADSTP